MKNLYFNSLVEKNDAKVSPLKINSTNKSKETLDNTSDIMVHY